MKVIIAGGRDFDDYERLEAEMDAMLTHQGTISPRLEIVQGGAKGADSLGSEWAASYGVKEKQFDADWDQYGKAAGHKRNYAMARYADVLVAFWDGESSGTRNMIDNALREGLEVHVFRY